MKNTFILSKGEKEMITVHTDDNIITNAMFSSALIPLRQMVEFLIHKKVDAPLISLFHCQMLRVIKYLFIKSISFIHQRYNKSA